MDRSNRRYRGKAERLSGDATIVSLDACPTRRSVCQRGGARGTAHRAPSSPLSVFPRQPRRPFTPSGSKAADSRTSPGAIGSRRPPRAAFKTRCWPCSTKNPHRRARLRSGSPEYPRPASPAPRRMRSALNWVGESPCGFNNSSNNCCSLSAVRRMAMKASSSRLLKGFVCFSSAWIPFATDTLYSL